MAEEFQAGICGGNWWNNSRSVLSAAAAASPCSMLGLNHDVAGFGWSSHNNNNNNNKARSNSSGDTNNSVCESPNMVFQEVLQKPHQTDCGNLLIDSTLQMMGFGLSPSDLNQSHNLIRNSGRSESTNMNNMYSILQEDMGLLTKLNSNNHQIQAYSANNNSYGYNSETLLQSFFDDEINQPLQQQSHSNNNYMSNYVPNNNNTSISPNVNNNNSWPRNNIPSANYKQLQFSNNAPFWNASETVMTSNASDHNNNNNHRSSLRLNNFHSVPQQYPTPTFEPKPKCNNNLTATKSSMVCNEDQAHQDSRSTCVVKKNISNGNEQPVIKRARIETPSPLPTFKVRKEKLGDRITALQQLVSPFGKTDTASVLHEAIEYIKFLHDQVSVLSTPYMKNGASSVQVHQKGSNKIKTQETPKQDLKSRGLCLVPISSTFPVANETTADFWTPTFGGNFRERE